MLTQLFLFELLQQFGSILSWESVLASCPIKASHGAEAQMEVLFHQEWKNVSDITMIKKKNNSAPLSGEVLSESHRTQSEENVCLF